MCLSSSSGATCHSERATYSKDLRGHVRCHDAQSVTLTVGTRPLHLRALGRPSLPFSASEGPGFTWTLLSAPACIQRPQERQSEMPAKHVIKQSDVSCDHLDGKLQPARERPARLTFLVSNTLCSSTFSQPLLAVFRELGTPCGQVLEDAAAM